MRRFLSRLFRSSSRPARKPRQARLDVESLESRTLLSVSAYFSGSQLIVNGDGSGNTIRLDAVGSGEFAQQRISYLSGGSWREVGRYGGFSSLLINSGTGSDTVNVDALIYPGSAITIQGQDGYDVVNLRALPRQAPVTVRNTVSYTELNITDPTGAYATNATIGYSSLTLQHPGLDNTYVVNYTAADLSKLNVNLGGAGNTVTVNDTPNSGYALLIPVGSGFLTHLEWDRMLTTIHTGGGADNVFVNGTTGPLTIEGDGSLDTVRVGSLSRGLQDIHSAVTVKNAPSYTALYVDDSVYAGARTATLSDTGISWSGPSAPAAINYVPRDLRALIVYGGSGADTYTVTDTPSSGYSGGMVATLYTGGGDDTVNIRKTTAPLSLSTGAGDDTVNIGNAANTLDDIQGTVSVTGEAGTDYLNVHDEGNIGQTYRVTGSGISRPGAAGIGFYFTTEWVTLDAGSGDDTFAVNSEPTVSTVILNGHEGDNTIVGPNNPYNSWQVYDTNAGFLNFFHVYFSGCANLIGGSGSDNFLLYDGVGVTGAIDGGAGDNYLDYSAYTTDVAVNLATGTATNVAAGVSRIQNVVGGAGNDLLVGDAGVNWLLGGPGRDVLIGGGGADRLNGGTVFPDDASEDDLLIAGSTAYDTDPAALAAIAQEWARDAGYDERVANLMSGVGEDGSIRLDATTVFDDGEADVLTGGDGQDWFFANLDQDVLADRLDTELVS
jgi:Ca2+-binding RTX toxin-like protein